MMRMLLIALLLGLGSPRVFAQPGDGAGVVAGNKKKKKKDAKKAEQKLSKKEIEESQKLTEQFRKRDRAREKKEARLAEWRKDKRPLTTMPPREIEEPKKKSPAYATDFDIYIFEDPTDAFDRE